MICCLSLSYKIIEIEQTIHKLHKRWEIMTLYEAATEFDFNLFKLQQVKRTRTFMRKLKQKKSSGFKMRSSLLATLGLFKKTTSWTPLLPSTFASTHTFKKKKKKALWLLEFQRQHLWLILTLGQNSSPTSCHSTQDEDVRSSKYVRHKREYLYLCFVHANLFLESTKSSCSKSVLPLLPTVPKSFEKTEK